MASASLKSAPLNAEEELIASKYQKKTDKQHILDNPNMYIGSIEKLDMNMWIYNERSVAGGEGSVVATEGSAINLKNIEFIPGLYKLFDEVLVNSRDHVIRMIQSPLEDKQNVSYIKVNIEPSPGGTSPAIITVCNDGDGIDIVKHPEYDIYIPELVFANLRTSTNYNKDEKRIVGGVNGIGVKLVFIWSKYAKIETIDARRKLKYVQEFHDNLNTISPPQITKCTTKPYTKITFLPDYERLGLAAENLSPDVVALFKKRVFDIAAITDHSVKKIKVYYNDVLVPIRNFKDYVEYYLHPSGGAGAALEEKPKIVYEENGERWEYAVAISPTGTFEQVSFVNGISTIKGGKHVEYILGQITKKLAAFIEKKKKITVSNQTIKEQLILFVRCDVENPSFDSQTKDCMNTPYGRFGSQCSITDGFIEKLSKIGIMDTICALTEIKDNRIAKKTDGSKTKTIRGIPNFIDANHAGGSKSKDCVLILCEGLSAMTGVVSGLTSSDRDIYGIYPLRGKLLNVRGENIKKISENKEITDLKKILGLETGREYTSIQDVHQHLRYGKIMYLVDSDVDGSHIKGLCVNLFQSEWGSLFRINGFLSFMNTPILKASKKGQPTQVFYNEGEFIRWKAAQQSNLHGWTIKYFKGLGTSTATEFKEYFTNKKVVDFIYDDETSDDVIDKIFNKRRADERKTWLENYNKDAYLNTSHPTVSYADFINQELIHFSVYDCQRSIPNLMDGLKTSQRKILYCAFKRRLTQEIKVAQLSGYVSENSSYHHGETSLNNAIVAMAQDFVGSNNINLLEPKGQFGSILQGGEDSASERYIFTHLNPLTRFIFPEMDDAILRYLEDDGMAIEPEYYCPILPFVLVNGSMGIGTGFSTSIPSYHPRFICQVLKDKIEAGRGEHQVIEASTPSPDFVPYYEGFKGSVIRLEPHKFLIKGVYSKVGEDQIQITALPVGTWTMPYLAFLETLMEGAGGGGAAAASSGSDAKKAVKKTAPIVKDFVSHSTEQSVNIRVVFAKGKLQEYESMAETSAHINGLEKVLKLTTTVTTTNLHLFDKDCKLKKYATIQEIVDEFYEVRLAAYGKRKAYLIDEMNKIRVKASNKARFISCVLNDMIDLRRKDAETIDRILQSMDFAQVEESFDYLIKMPMNSVSKENIARLMKERDDAEAELNEIVATTVEDMWLRDLAAFETQYEGFVERRRRKDESEGGGSGASKGGKTGTIKIIRKQAAGSTSHKA